MGSPTFMSWYMCWYMCCLLTAALLPPVATATVPKGGGAVSDASERRSPTEAETEAEETETEEAEEVPRPTESLTYARRKLWQR